MGESRGKQEIEHRRLRVRKGWLRARVQDGLKALGKHRERNREAGERRRKKDG